MKNESNDRVEQGLAYWFEKEKRLKEYTRQHITNTPHFQKEKLQYYISLKDQLKKEGLTKEEKSTMKIVKGEIRELEKSLYPFRIQRIFIRAMRQAKKVMDKLNIPEKMQAFAERVLNLNKKQVDSSQSYKYNQSHSNSQTVSQSQDKKQDIKSDSNTVQTQKNDVPGQNNVIPMRNIIFDTPVRNENRKENLKNNSLKEGLPKPRHRHRLH